MATRVLPHVRQACCLRQKAVNLSQPLKWKTALANKASTAPVELDWRSKASAVAQVLNNASSVLVVTGAGMSADSGMPTYRGVGGLYESKDTDEGLDITEALSATILKEKPWVTWKYLKQLEKSCRGVVPNRGHYVVSDMEHYFDRVLVLTQNIDGLHQLAGSENVIDIHGDFRRLRCTNCHHPERVKNYKHLQRSLIPICKFCGGFIRPEIVLFEEPLDQQKLDWLWAETLQGFDVVFSIGTSSLFSYITEPVRFSRGISVEINKGQTEMTPEVDHHIEAGAAEALVTIWKEFLRLRGE